jgi:CDP-diacylglycerol pyrophosphatase
MASHRPRLRLSWRRGAVVLGALLAVCAPIVLLGAASDPLILWKIVNGACVVDQTRSGKPAPCTRVDLAGGYAILKDITGTTQYLLIPTTRLTGIESPALLAPSAHNYFAEAWGQIGLVSTTLAKPLPRQDLSLAINSIYGRTQQQLHIHLDCLRRDVRDALARHAAAIGPHWAPFPEKLAGEPYRALRIDGVGLGDANPFQLLATGEPGARTAMGSHTLVVAGETFDDGAPGFILLDGVAMLSHGNTGSGEDLQDHHCALAAGRTR